MKTRRLFVILLPLLLLSCGSPGDPGSNGEVLETVSNDFIGFGEVDSKSPIIHVKDVVETVDVFTFDWGHDIPQFELAPEEGGFLWPCTESADCLSSYCIDTEAYGQVCTDYCESECPLNWKCKGKQIGADLIYLCTPPEEDLCEPCEEDDDCGSPEDLCLEVGYEAGKFCTMACANDDSCPANYVCSEGEVDGELVRQCWPESDSCICLGDLDQKHEPCWEENEWGKCFGEEVCDGPYGWTECTAKIPAEEICDGVDNDCDSEKDEELTPEDCEVSNEHGSCFGTTACLGEEGWACDAPEPGPEVCDGVDNDCNGEIDENFPELGEPCDSPDDDDSCAEGTWTCDPEEGSLGCVGDQPHFETCNGEDDNCDGVADDPWPDKGEPCDSTDTDLCKNGVWICDEGGGQLLCEGDENFEEVCNGLDDDCNGITDDGYPDYDWDLLADCIDLDDDGDDIPEDGDMDGTEGNLPCWGPNLLAGCDDNCPQTANTDQTDLDGDGEGDICDDDDDNDGVKDPVDNCKFIANPGQKDADADGMGDACDIDDDNDGVPDDGDESGEAGDSPCTPDEFEGCDDNCPLTFNPLQADNELDGLGDECDEDDDNDGAPDLLDCEPTDPAVFPDNEEVCNGIDDNCDGLADPAESTGCQEFHIDVDGDDFGFTGLTQCVCGDEGSPPFTAIAGGDCNDSNPDIHPLAEEICNSVDDNCDEDIDNEGALGCEVRYKDSDEDLYGVFADKKCVCGAKGEYSASEAGDCDDNDPAVHPGASEFCNGKDDNCDYSTDEEGTLGCNDYYLDKDKDDWGIDGLSKCLCAPYSSFSAAFAGDCDDGDDEIFPGMDEICDGKDNNCNSSIDEEDASGCQDYFEDFDGDGFGNAANSKCLCSPKDTYTTQNGADCDDTNKFINVGSAETCNGLDDDCDGTIDNNTNDCEVYFYDGDQDGFGLTEDTMCMCQPGQGYTATIGGDCADNLFAMHPGATELCNNEDDDCNGTVDDEDANGCANFYEDADQDGYGNSFKAKCLCAPHLSYSTVQGADCNDLNPQANPGMDELCDGFDNNCNNQTDEDGADGCIVYFKDEDGDGFGVTVAQKCTCAPSGIYSATLGGDCNDQSFIINPGIVEECDGVDNNCIGGVDEGFPDNDGDGIKDCLDQDKDGDGDPFGQDCDDEDPTVSHFAQEKCNNKDDNCNGSIDEENALGCQTYFYDGDQDGYGQSSNSKCMCDGEAQYSTTQGLDCDDTKAFVFPGAVEQCNGVDDNCNNSVDEGNPVSMCGSVDHGSGLCVDGECKIGQCELHYYDLDNAFDTGCECGTDDVDLQGIGNVCTMAYDLGELPDSGSQKSVDGNLVPGEDEDWYSFGAPDSPDTTCNTYSPKIEFTKGSSFFRFEVYRDGCDSVDDLVCQDADTYEWTVNFYTGDAGECPCTNEMGPGGTDHYSVPGAHFCSPHGANYFVKVMRKPGVAANCYPYTLRVSNGM